MGLKQEHPNRSNHSSKYYSPKKELYASLEVIDYNAGTGTCKVSLEYLRKQKTGSVKKPKGRTQVNRMEKEAGAKLKEL